ncbi:MAG TPA: hypothetical protein VFG87_08110 [Amycolatopsis sp.]|nr:hypothetical protein [Amycolatopsis sp.]
MPELAGDLDAAVTHDGAAAAHRERLRTAAADDPAAAGRTTTVPDQEGYLTARAAGLARS